MTDRNIALSAEFLKMAGYEVEVDEWPDGGYFDDGVLLDIPDLTTEANLGWVVRIVREAGITLTLSVYHEEGNAMASMIGPHSLSNGPNPNIALMTAFIRAKGGTVPDEEDA